MTEPRSRAPTQCAATLSTTAPAKHTTAAARSAHPARSLGRPVTMPTIASDMHATETSASSKVNAFSTAEPPYGARMPSSRR